MENKTQWKLPSEVAFTEWVKSNTKLYVCTDKGYVATTLRDRWADRTKQAESDLAAALDLLEEIMDRCRRGQPISASLYAEIDNHIKQYKP